MYSQFENVEGEWLDTVEVSNLKILELLELKNGANLYICFKNSNRVTTFHLWERNSDRFWERLAVLNFWLWLFKMTLIENGRQRSWWAIPRYNQWPCVCDFKLNRCSFTRRGDELHQVYFPKYTTHEGIPLQALKTKTCGGNLSGVHLRYDPMTWHCQGTDNDNDDNVWSFFRNFGR